MYYIIGQKAYELLMNFWMTSYNIKYNSCAPGFPLLDEYSGSIQVFHLPKWI